MCLTHLQLCHLLFRAWDEAREGVGRLYGHLMKMEAWDKAREGVGRLYEHLMRREAWDEAREGVGRLQTRTQSGV